MIQPLFRNCSWEIIIFVFYLINDWEQVILSSLQSITCSRHGIRYLLINLVVDANILYLPIVTVTFFPMIQVQLSNFDRQIVFIFCFQMFYIFLCRNNSCKLLLPVVLIKKLGMNHFTLLFFVIALRHY